MARQKQAFPRLNKYFHFIFQVIKKFLDDGCLNLSASISYYIVFSLPPLLVFIVLFAGLFIDPGWIKEAIYKQILNLIGERGVRLIQAIIENSNRPGAGNFLTIFTGFAALIFGATGSFLSIQRALNTAWEVMPDPQKGGAIKIFFLKRLLSLGLILVIIVLFFVSMIISILSNSFGDILARFLPRGELVWILLVLNWVITLCIMTLLFAVMYKYLPDERIFWRYVWPGAIFAAILFMIGKDLFAFFIGNTDFGNVFGDAGAMVIILLWIYLTSIILLLGAEFTQVWIYAKHKTIKPLPGAVHFVKKITRDTNE